MIEPYFGLTRVEYLQHLANRYGDFGVSWNFIQDDGSLGFTKKRTVIDLWQEDYLHPSESRLNNVMHRHAVPIEFFAEVDDHQPIAYLKKSFIIKWCKGNHKQYCVYKSRKGYHISILIGKHNVKDKRFLVKLFQSDPQYTSFKVQWSLEWSRHWKDNNFILLPIEISPRYENELLNI